MQTNREEEKKKEILPLFYRKKAGFVGPKGRTKFRTSGGEKKKKRKKKKAVSPVAAGKVRCST